MAQSKEVIDALKSELKSNGYTYADVARKLKLSEISIKRMFSQNHFTLARLESICEMLQCDFTDLVRIVDEERTKISSLTEQQEQELVSDPKFLVIAISVQNSWTFDEIISYYDISEPECISYLTRLDRLGLIQLLPNNRIKRMVAQDFRWLARGPIEGFFEQHVQSAFLKSHFSRPGDLRLYLTGMVSRGSLESLRSKIEMLAREFNALQKDDSRLPAKARFNIGLMVAMRPWEFPGFSKLKRQND